jgi:hypothetical protein
VALLCDAGIGWAFLGPIDGRAYGLDQHLTGGRYNDDPRVKCRTAGVSLLRCAGPRPPTPQFLAGLRDADGLATNCYPRSQDTETVNTRPPTTGRNPGRDAAGASRRDRSTPNSALLLLVQSGSAEAAKPRSCA